MSNEDDNWRKQNAGNQGCVTYAFQSLSALHSAHYHSNHYLLRNLCTQNSVKSFLYVHPSLAYTTHSTRCAEGSKSVDCRTIWVRRCGKTLPHSGKPAICR